MSLKWLFKRLAFVIPSLIGISLITFFISALIPGDPVSALVGERADASVIEAYRKKLGLQHSLPVRYFFYIKTILNGDLGKSYYTGQNVGRELVNKLPNTLLLALSAMVFAVVFGLFFGVMSALYSDTFFDKCIRLVSSLLISLPVFWFGMLLIYLFSYKMKILPVGGMLHPFSFVLPAITLGSRSMGYLIRLTRTTMLENLNAEYVICVRAKGGKRKDVVFHSFVNALIPVVTFIGLDFGSYMNGSVLTETIFGWNGIGRFAMNGILRRDYPVIIGSVLFGALVFILINMCIDIFYTFLNPKLRRGGIK